MNAANKSRGVPPWYDLAFAQKRFLSSKVRRARLSDRHSKRFVHVIDGTVFISLAEAVRLAGAARAKIRFNDFQRFLWKQDKLRMKKPM
jgi:hypothetical protein